MIRVAAVVAVLAITAIVAIQSRAGWHGADIHLVDHVWVGTETACGGSQTQDDIDCRLIVAQGVAFAKRNRVQVTKSARASLPTAFVTTSGERRTARLSVGVLTREAVVVDLSDGTRRVIGLLCQILHPIPPTDEADEVLCSLDPLDYWVDGNVPPSIGPDDIFS